MTNSFGEYKVVQGLGVSVLLLFALMASYDRVGYQLAGLLGGLRQRWRWRDARGSELVGRVSDLGVLNSGIVACPKPKAWQTPLVQNERKGLIGHACSSGYHQVGEPYAIT